MQPKITIHNHLPAQSRTTDRRTRDHWYRVHSQGGFTLYQGAGVDGGRWKVDGHGESKTFRTRREAEDHMQANLHALGY